MERDYLSDGKRRNYSRTIERRSFENIPGQDAGDTRGKEWPDFLWFHDGRATPPTQMFLDSISRWEQSSTNTFLGQGLRLSSTRGVLESLHRFCIQGGSEPSLHGTTKTGSSWATFICWTAMSTQQKCGSVSRTIRERLLISLWPNITRKSGAIFLDTNTYWLISFGLLSLALQRPNQCLTWIGRQLRHCQTSWLSREGPTNELSWCR